MMLLSILENINPEWKGYLYVLAWVLFALIYVGVIVTILIENRNPVKSLAYILIFILLPGVGLLVYFIIGRDQRYKKKFTFKGTGDLLRIREFSEVYKPYFEDIRRSMEAEYPGQYSVSQLFSNLRQSILTDKNKIEILINGEQKFESLLKDIATARHHIHMEYYIFNDDETGNRVADALVKMAQQGIQVRFIYDDFGSSEIGDLPEILETGGVEVFAFDPLRGSLYTNANYRNHRKIVVIDGTVSYIGGINIGNDYDNRRKDHRYWRDTSVRLCGNASNMLQLQFLLSYKYASGGKTFPFDFPYFRLDHEGGTAFIDIVGSGPDSAKPYNMLGMVAAVNSALSSVSITNPYFIPNAEFITALELAAGSGKHVRLLLPEKADSRFVQWAMDSYIRQILRSGVEVYRYRKGFIHAKTMTIDDTLSTIGTVNLDNRSFYLNFEIEAYIYDRETNKIMQLQFEEDLKESPRLTLAEWEKRSWVTRVMESLCRLLTPLL